MIADILLSWNVLTVTLVAWLACILLVLAKDFGPEIYREQRARHFMANVTIQVIAERKAKKPITFDPEATFQLGVFKIQPQTATRRKHAKVTA